MEFWAHSANKACSPWEPLKDHIEKVAWRAAEYAEIFGAKDEAVIAGQWHDLGKYSELFNKRLEGKVNGLDHWSSGAFAALVIFREKALAAALAIQGHHVGLQEGSPPGIYSGCDMSILSQPSTHPLGLTLTTPDWKRLLENFKADGFKMPSSPGNSLYDFAKQPVKAMLDARMLFSTLVDADYIETEAHFEGKSDGTKIYRSMGESLQTEKAFEVVFMHIKELDQKATSSVNVQTIRRTLLSECLKKAESSRGIFTLTAPTGSGKTLAMLAFALKHAIIHPRIRRIIMVLPFLNLIEQSAKTYRRLLEPHFGQNYIVENHSLADINRKEESSTQERDNEQEANRTTRLLAENWEAPIIITTSVQFFESLFANSPAKCRKLHRLADSIVLFDEVQTLPTHIVVPSLAALTHLMECYGSTVVFSTATQPAFDHLHEKVKKYATGGWNPAPIVSNSTHLFDLASRVTIDWQIKVCRSWDSISDELATEENSRSLCIVNLKRHAQDLVNKLRERINEDGLFHLSTNMCPEHRRKVIDKVHVRLHASLKCRLVSTQCIEAGVDVDFPVVWRAFGPLDAIVQAAGRCNREGKLSNKGCMVVFLPTRKHEKENIYPPGGYKEAAETTATLLRMIENEANVNRISREKAFNIFTPEIFNRYYKLLYDLTGATDLDKNLDDAIQRRSFIDVAKSYRLIDKNNISILVPYPDEMALFNSLKNRLTETGRLTREWIRDAMPLTVSLYRPKLDATVWNYLDPVPLGHHEKAEDWFIYLNPEDYDPLIGLKPPDEVDAWMI